jgi:hypothetical protein
MPEKYPFKLNGKSRRRAVDPVLWGMSQFLFFQTAEKRGRVYCEVCGEEWNCGICWLRKAPPVLLRELRGHMERCKP